MKPQPKPTKAVPGCKKHPRYKGVYLPRVRCKACKKVYEASPFHKKSLKDVADERKQAMRIAVATFNRYIRMRDHNRCIVCGTRENPTAGHCFSAVAESTRFDEQNVYCQCRNCNFDHERDFEKFRRKVEERLGKEAYDALVMRYWTSRKLTIDEIRDIIETYEGKIEELQHGTQVQPEGSVHGSGEG